MRELKEYNKQAEAERARERFERLGYRPFGVFPTARGTWAFWIS